MFNSEIVPNRKLLKILLFFLYKENGIKNSNIDILFILN